METFLEFTFETSEDEGFNGWLLTLDTQIILGGVSADASEDMSEDMSADMSADIFHPMFCNLTSFFRMF